MSAWARGVLAEALDSECTQRQAEHQARDTLGRVYEYFLGRFASAEGKRGGEFYTPASVVRTLVTMLAPYKGRIYDPCCGSGGMFVQSEKLSKPTAAKWATSASTGKNPTPTHGSWPS
jgi:Type I restriction-modification system methyltransferase subunit